MDIHANLKEGPTVQQGYWLDNWIPTSKIYQTSGPIRSAVMFKTLHYHGFYGGNKSPLYNSNPPFLTTPPFSKFLKLLPPLYQLPPLPTFFLGVPPL